MDSNYGFEIGNCIALNAPKVFDTKLFNDPSLCLHQG